MQNSFVGVYGCSGFGKEVLPVLVDQITYHSELKPLTKVYFVDDNPLLNMVNGCQVLPWSEFSSLDGTKRVVIAIADPRVRKLLHGKLQENSVKMLDVRARNVVIYDQVCIGEGSIILSGCILTSNISIGVGFHANINSYVAHDCLIGDYVTFAPCVKCNGNVVIEDGVYVGTGAIIKQGKPDRPLVIGKGAKIEAGSYVTKSVPPGQTVFGSPARQMTISSLRALSK